MRFLSIYRTVEQSAPPCSEEMSTMGMLIQKGTQEGWLIATEGCLPTSLGARVRRSSGKLTVTDGPFTESKEVVAGLAILQANSKEEAIELTRKFLTIAGAGECELRQLHEPTSPQPGQRSCHELAELAVRG